MISPRRGPGVPARAMNGVVAVAVGRLGLPLGALRMLHVRGRRTGRVHAVPVLVLTQGGRRYLVAPRGRTDWALNLRAAGQGELARGRRRVRVGAEPVTGAERADVIAAYVRQFGWLTGRFFAVPRRPSRADVEAIAPRHPVFRLVPGSGAGDRAPALSGRRR